MYQKTAKHPLSTKLEPLSDKTFAAMWQIFVHIGKFWQNIDDPTPYKSQLYSFMLNRINLRPIYSDYYISAQEVMTQLITEKGEDEAYKYLFTDKDAAKAPPETFIAVTRQNVANEFIALQLSLGGFKAFGAENYCGYIGGANIPSQPAPYRTFVE
ncbi:hypothetical protein [Calothrix sp. PCC 6303]|uniref:hypothetical protein n=1 Tax=Calothrix sp. PCC 6303 TaxID=1170562 RepID=UPI0002A0340D|nr:hypothetical protein [Calothrix sp. PCC 6303]AFY99441.1 hypothetical protein Cal6303_0361 [Calothrix sp. PCC 6303]